MPVDVAVEKPHTRVVCYEADDVVTSWWEHHDVSSHWDGTESGMIAGIKWQGVAVCVVVEVLSVGRNSLDDLEVVPVQMERVRAPVVVVENDLDNIIVIEDERVRVVPVDLGIGGQIAGRQDGIDSRHFGRRVADVV